MIKLNSSKIGKNSSKIDINVKDKSIKQINAKSKLNLRLIKNEIFKVYL